MSMKAFARRWLCNSVLGSITANVTFGNSPFSVWKQCVVQAFPEAEIPEDMHGTAQCDMKLFQKQKSFLSLPLSSLQSP